MIHRISAEDLILQKSASQLDDSCSIASSFTLQDRVEAIQQSSEEFHEMVGWRTIALSPKFSYVINLWMKDGILFSVSHIN